MYRVCITKIPREIWQRLTDFEYRKMAFSGYLNIYNFQRVVLVAREADAMAMYFMYTSEEKTFLSLQIQRHGPINWAKSNWTSFDIYTPFYLPVSSS